MFEKYFVHLKPKGARGEASSPRDGLHCGLGVGGLRAPAADVRNAFRRGRLPVGQPRCGLRRFAGGARPCLLPAARARSAATAARRCRASSTSRRSPTKTHTSASAHTNSLSLTLSLSLSQGKLESTS